MEKEFEKNKAEYNQQNTNILKELKSRPSNEDVQRLVTDTVKKETVHIITIMKNLVQECQKTSPQPQVDEYRALDEA